MKPKSRYANSYLNSSPSRSNTKSARPSQTKQNLNSSKLDSSMPIRRKKKEQSGRNLGNYTTKLEKRMALQQEIDSKAIRQNRSANVRKKARKKFSYLRKEQEKKKKKARKGSVARDKTPERLVKTDHIEIKYRDSEVVEGKKVRKEQSQGQFEIIGIKKGRESRKHKQKKSEKEISERGRPGKKNKYNKESNENQRRKECYRSNKRLSEGIINQSGGSFIDLIKSEVKGRDSKHFGRNEQIERDMKKKRLSAAPVLITRSEIPNLSLPIQEESDLIIHQSPERKNQKFQTTKIEEEKSNNLTDLRDPVKKSRGTGNVFLGLGRKSRDIALRKKEDQHQTNQDLKTNDIDKYRERPIVNNKGLGNSGDQTDFNDAQKNNFRQPIHNHKIENMTHNLQNEITDNRKSDNIKNQNPMMNIQTPNSIKQSETLINKNNNLTDRNRNVTLNPQKDQTNHHIPKPQSVKKNTIDHTRNTSIAVVGLEDITKLKERPVKSALELPGRNSSFRKGMNLRDIRRAFKNRKDLRMKSQSKAEMVKQTLEEERRKMREEEIRQERMEAARFKDLERKRKIDAIRKNFKKQRQNSESHTVRNYRENSSGLEEQRIRAQTRIVNSSTPQEIQNLSSIDPRKVQIQHELRDFGGIASVQRVETEATHFDSNDLYQSHMKEPTKLEQKLDRTNNLQRSMEPKMVTEKVDRKKDYQSGQGTNLYKERIKERIEETQRNLLSKVETMKRQTIIQESDIESSEQQDQVQDLNLRNYTADHSNPRLDQELQDSVNNQPTQLNKTAPVSALKPQKNQQNPKPIKKTRKSKNPKTNPRKFKPKTSRKRETHPKQNIPTYESLDPTPQNNDNRNRLFTSQPIVMNNNFVNYNYYINDIRGPSETLRPGKISNIHLPTQNEEKKKYFEKYEKKFGVAVEEEISAQEIKNRQEENKKRKKEIMGTRAVKDGIVNPEVLKMRMKEMKAEKKTIERELGFKGKGNIKMDRIGKSGIQTKKEKNKKREIAKIGRKLDKSQGMKRKLRKKDKKLNSGNLNVNSSQKREKKLFKKENSKVSKILEEFERNREKNNSKPRERKTKTYNSFKKEKNPEIHQKFKQLQEKKETKPKTKKKLINFAEMREKKKKEFDQKKEESRKEKQKKEKEFRKNFRKSRRVNSRRRKNKKEEKKEEEKFLQAIADVELNLKGIEKEDSKTKNKKKAKDRSLPNRNFFKEKNSTSSSRNQKTEKNQKSKRAKILAKTENLYGYNKRQGKQKKVEVDTHKKATRTSEISWNSRKSGSEKRKNKKTYQNSKNSVFRKRKNVAKEVVIGEDQSKLAEENYQSEKKKEFYRNIGMLVEIDSSQFLSESSKGPDLKKPNKNQKMWNSNQQREKNKKLPRFGRDNSKRKKQTRGGSKGKYKSNAEVSKMNYKKLNTRNKKDGQSQINSRSNSIKSDRLSQSERPRNENGKPPKLRQFGSKPNANQDSRFKRDYFNISASTPTRSLNTQDSKNNKQTEAPKKKLSYKGYKKNTAQLRREELSKKKRLEFIEGQKKKEENKGVNKGHRRRKSKSTQNKRKYEQKINKGYGNKNLANIPGFKRKAFANQDQTNNLETKNRKKIEKSNYGTGPVRSANKKIKPVNSTNNNTPKRKPKKYRNLYSNKYQRPAFKKKRNPEKKINEPTHFSQRKDFKRDDSWRWEGESQINAPKKNIDPMTGEELLEDQLIESTNISMLPALPRENVDSPRISHDSGYNNNNNNNQRQSDNYFFQDQHQENLNNNNLSQRNQIESQTNQENKRIQNLEIQSCGPDREIDIPRFNTGSAKGWNEDSRDNTIFEPMNDNLNPELAISHGTHPSLSKSNSEQFNRTNTESNSQKRDFFKKKWKESPTPKIEYVEGQIGGLMKKTLTSVKAKKSGSMSQVRSEKHIQGQPRDSGNIIDSETISKIEASMNLNKDLSNKRRNDMFKKTDLLDPKFDEAIPKLSRMLKGNGGLEDSESLETLIKKKAVKNKPIFTKEINLRERKSLNMAGLTSDLDMIINGVDSMMTSQRTPFLNNSRKQARQNELEKSLPIKPKKSKNSTPNRIEKKDQEIQNSPISQRNKSETNLSDQSSDDEKQRMNATDPDSPLFETKVYKKGKHDASLEKPDSELDLLGEPMSLEEVRKMKKDLGIVGKSEDFQEYLSGSQTVTEELDPLKSSHPFLENEEDRRGKAKRISQNNTNQRNLSSKIKTDTFNQFEYSETGDEKLRFQKFEISNLENTEGMLGESWKDLGLERIEEEKRLKMAEDTGMMTMDFQVSSRVMKDLEPEAEINDNIQGFEIIKDNQKELDSNKKEIKNEMLNDKKPEKNMNQDSFEIIDELSVSGVQEKTENSQIINPEEIIQNIEIIKNTKLVNLKKNKSPKKKTRKVFNENNFNKKIEKKKQEIKLKPVVSPKDLSSSMPLYSKKIKKKDKIIKPIQQKTEEESGSQPQVLLVAQREKSPIPMSIQIKSKTSKIMTRSINLSHGSQQWNSKFNSRNNSKNNSRKNSLKNNKLKSSGKQSFNFSPEKKKGSKRASAMRYSRKLQKKLPPSLTSSYDGRSPNIPSSISASWHSQVGSMEMRVSLKNLSPSSKQKRLDRYARNPVKKEALRSEMDKILQSVKNLSRASHSSREQRNSRVSSIEKLKQKSFGMNNQIIKSKERKKKLSKSANDLGNQEKKAYFKQRKLVSKFIKQRSQEFDYKPDLSEIQSEASVNLDISVDLEYQMLKCSTCMLYFKQRDLLIHQRNCG